MTERSALYTLGFIIIVLIAGGFLFFLLIYRWSHSLELEVASRTKKLKEANDYLNNLIRFASAPIIVWDPEFRITRFNRAFERLTGYNAEDVVSQGLSMFFHELSRDESLSKIERTLRGEYWESVEIPILRKDGEIRIALWNSANIYAEDDTTLLATIAQGIDITERKWAEAQRAAAQEALRESEEHYRELVEKAGIAIVMDDQEGNFDYFNDEFVKIFGYSPDEIKQHTIRSLVHPDDVEMVVSYHQARLQGNEVPARYEFRGIKKNGTTVFLEVDVVCLREEKSIIGTRSYFWDITERKRAEEQIKASLKEKEVLLREIHHRVKNNLQVISSLLNLQARTVKDKDTIDILSESKNRINAMALIHTQLYESKDLSEINMKGFIERLINQLFHSYPVQDVKITPIISVVDHPFPISIAVPLGLIINELLSNAFKYAFVKRGNGRIEVILSASEKGKISLSVGDDGVGLPEVFDINKTKTLGLHLVKILVEDQLQGKLDVISKKGTVFHIEFDIKNNES